MVMLPKVSMGGIYQIDLGSFHSIVDINSGLDFIQALIGRFAMVPLKLMRVPRESHADGIKAVHYPLQIVLSNADVDSVNALRDDNRRVLTAASRLALAPPEDCNPKFDDGAVTVEDQDGAKPAASVKEMDSVIPEDIPDIEPEAKADLPQVPAQAQAATPKAPDPEPPRQSRTKTQPPKEGLTSEKSEQPATSIQQSAIFKLATKAGIEESVVLQRMQGMTIGIAAGAIVSLQRGDTALFRGLAA